MPATVVTEPARPTRVRACVASTTAAALVMAASMSAVAAAICAPVGGSARRCRSVIRTQPMSTLRADVTSPSAPSTNSVEPPPMSTTR